MTAASLAKRGRPIFVMRVAPSSSVANKSVRVAGLKGLDGAFLVAVGRLGHLVSLELFFVLSCLLSRSVSRSPRWTMLPYASPKT